jgi:hypothetical protein
VKGAILGATVALVVFLIAAFVLVSQFGGSSLSALASTAQSYYGGQWQVNPKSFVAAYKGNGTYAVTLANGSAVTVSVSNDLNAESEGANHYASLGGHLIGYDRVLEMLEAYAPNYVVLASINGTVNGQKALIVVIAMEWNSSDSPAGVVYNLTSALYNETVEAYSATKFVEPGLISEIGKSDGHYYVYFYQNLTARFAVGMEINGLPIDVRASYFQVSPTAMVGVLAINVNATEAQLQAIANQALNSV